jgi:hypothetical protein
LVKVFRKFGRIVLPNPSKACINLDKKWVWLHFLRFFS